MYTLAVYPVLPRYVQLGLQVAANPSAKKGLLYVGHSLTTSKVGHFHHYLPQRYRWRHRNEGHRLHTLNDAKKVDRSECCPPCYARAVDWEQRPFLPGYSVILLPNQLFVARQRGGGATLANTWSGSSQEAVVVEQVRMQVREGF